MLRKNELPNNKIDLRKEVVGKHEGSTYIWRMEKYFTLTEWIGYLASAAILVSFLMKEIRNLRIINFIGCGLFVTYGFMIDSWPVIISNIAIAGIHVYYLQKMQKNPS